MKRILARALFAFASASLLAGQAAAAPPQSGGTLRLVVSSAAGTFDPQVNYTVEYAEMFQMMYDGLVAFRKAGGTDGFNIVPDLSTNVPTPTDGGLTYVFHLRPGIKFSNGQAVTLNDVVNSFRRLFKVNSPNAGTWYNVIVGGDACLTKPDTCTLPGIVTDPATNSIIFHLVHPDSEFLDQMAFPFAVILPADTPNHDMGTTYIPGTGAYTVKTYDPNKGLSLIRNPYFKLWSDDAQPTGYPDQVEYRFGITPESQVTAVENGQYDWMFDTIPTDRLNEIALKYTKQVHLNPLEAVWYAPFNINIPPFNNLDARLAVEYAVNLEDSVKLYGGDALATPTCQILPPGIPGYVPYCPFTKNPGTQWSAPDWPKAMAYMKASGMAGQHVTIVTQSPSPYAQIGVDLQSTLNKLGFKADVKPISPNIQFTYIQNTNNNVQMSVTTWYQDYPAPSDFLNVLYGCASFNKGSDNSINISGFCDKAVDAQMQAAMLTTLTDPAKANAMWTTIDHQMTDRALAVNLFNPRKADFVSARLHHFVFSGEFQFLPQLASVR